MMVPEGQDLSNYGQIICFGDSITEGAWDTEWHGWGAALASRYSRRLDVVNRGFGGYNTRNALKVLPQIFSHIDDRVKLVILFFGANDSAPEDVSQHVPLLEYIKNLDSLTSFPALKDKVLLCSPPPKDDYKMGPGVSTF